MTVPALGQVLSSPALDTRYRTHLRLVRADAEDAAYICRLRGDPKLNRFLNVADVQLEAQLAWLVDYKRREAAGEEFYFVIMCDGAPAGLVRMYDFREAYGARSFCWGSWIIPKPRPNGLVVYSVLLVYEIGFDTLGFEQSHFDVRRGNVGVLAFHNRAGATRVSSDDENAYFTYDPAAYRAFREANQGQVEQHRILSGG